MKNVHILTSAYVAKKSNPLEALFSGGNASEDCTMASKASRRASLAMMLVIVLRVALGDVLEMPLIGSGVRRRCMSLGNSNSGS